MPKVKAEDTQYESVGSIAAALGDAYDAQVNESEEDDADKPELKEPEAKETKARDETGKFAKKEEADKAVEEAHETKEAVEPATPVKVIEPEEHWSETDKVAFRAIPDEHKPWVYERYKRVEADNTKKSQEAASLRTYKQNLDSVLGPYRQEFAMAGMDEIGGVRYLLSVRDFVRNNPAQGIAWLAQQFGVNPEQIGDVPQIDPVNQQVGKLGDKINQLEQQIQNERLEQANKMVTGFASEKDESGQLKHPHFETVVDTMTQLMKFGVVPLGDLTQAYQQSVALHNLGTPAIKTPAVAAATAQVKEPKQVELDKAAVAKKAKAASAGITGGATGKSDRPMSLREELTARIDGYKH